MPDVPASFCEIDLGEFIALARLGSDLGWECRNMWA